MKQRNGGIWWGHLKQLISQIGLYAFIVNLALLIPTAFNTTFYPWWYRMFGVELSFWWFMGAVLLVFGLMALVEWSFGLRSYFSSWTSQFWTPDNPMRKDMERLDRQQKAIMKHLGIKDD
jgi:uncharacterized membrane protein